MSEAIAAEPYSLVVGHWKEETYAIHGPSGHIASGVQPSAARAIVDELNRLSRPAPAVQVPEGFASDVMTAAGLLAHGKRDKGLAERLRIGAVAMLAAPTPATMATEAVAQGGAVGGWIPVGERLPDMPSGYVLVHCEGGNITNDFFCHDREFHRHAGKHYFRKVQGKESGYFQCAHKYGYRVTHWQPLPPPPAATKERKREQEN